MTKDQLLERLQELQNPNGDPERNHSEADQLLVAFIADERVAEAFDAIDKWYA